jgi:AraC-like DNA-binding protein
MKYVTFAPSPKLAQFVRFFWALEADLSEGEEFVHRSVADGSVEMVFHYRATFDEIDNNGVPALSPISNIQGQSTGFRRFVTSDSFGLFGAYLYPFAIPRFFGFPATDITNLSPDIHSVLGVAGKRLEDAMCSAPRNEERVRIITTFLETQLDSREEKFTAVHNSVMRILGAKGMVSVEKLAGELNISVRHFERKFKEIAGLTPKLYANVIRFQAATHHKAEGVRDLTSIAYECGYYDQSHFINDFRRFSGYSPKEYFWNNAEGTQYLSI